MTTERTPSREVNPEHMRERPQNNRSHEPGGLDKRSLTERLNTHRRALREMREIMSQLQAAASYTRRRFHVVPEDLRLALRESRTSHRELISLIRTVEAEMTAGEEE